MGECATRLIGPVSIDQHGGNVAGQILSQQRNGLTLGADKIVANSHVGVAGDAPAEEDPSGTAVARCDAGREHDAKLARRDNIARLKGKTGAVVIDNASRHDHISVPFSVKPIGAILLELLAQLMCDRITKPRFKGIVQEWLYFDGTRTGFKTGRRAELVSRATGEERQR